MVYSSLSWNSPPKMLTLRSGLVHVWRAGLNISTYQLHTLQAMLAAEECVRAARFFFQKDREHFVARRGILRNILSRYLDREPSQLRFCYNSYGKPSLAEEVGEKELCFNLSHSDGLALYALTWGRKIGIDIEHLRADVADEEVAERYFSLREVAVLRALPRHLRKEAFFSCWTRKEAYIKAEGKGLYIPLDSFDVSLAPGAPAALLRTQRHAQETFCWSLQSLNPEHGYAAALAVKGHGLELECWQWSPTI